MRKLSLILAVLIASVFITELHAQSHNIFVSLSKELKNGETYVKVSIKNNNPFSISFLTKARWHGTVYTQRPISYVQLIGNPNESVKSETSELVLTKDIGPKYIEKTRIYTEINQKETYTIDYKIFGGNVPYNSFPSSEKGKLKQLRAKVILKYMNHLDEKFYELELLSNIISL